MVDQVLISSFNHDYLLQVKSLNANIRTGRAGKAKRSKTLSSCFRI